MKADNANLTPPEDVRWRLTTPSSWLDPDSWEPDGRPADPRDLEAVPHLERIPCGQDVAVFRDKAFLVVVPDFPVRAAALAFEGTVYTSGTGWLLGILLKDAMLSRTYFTQLPTKLMASSVEQVSSLAEQCGLGVEEGADERHVERAGQLAADELMAGVCLHVTCPVPRCAAPVRPHLHCCFVCGAVLELRPVPDRADLDRMRQVLRSEALRYETRWGAGSAPGVHLGVVPSPSGGRGLAQVVFVGENAEDMAAIILADIQSIVSADEARLLVSGAMIAPASVGSVLGVLVGSLFVVLVAMAAMVYFHYGALPLPSRLEGLFLNEKQTSFLFARFENTPEESGAVVSVLGRPQQPGVRSARGSWSARSFRNPLYEQGQSDEDAAPPPPPRGVAHENPLFSALREKLDGSSEHDEEGDQRQGDDTTLGVNLVDITL
ncbi:protein amnionless [Frankliniella occidentalis]|uniref:Protein amnionless n=1 Tax=Frankliniella occidentalis TaxID=133901 RepID=A0A9C6WW99_FRAOC|nr:protein amnionless [Frankliniella occidentalis]